MRKRVYVSATFADLEPFRARILRELRRHDFEPLGMEDYAASDERPKDKCLHDIDTCDAYVGLFAYRYGHIPDADNPERLSITELEYRHAASRHLPCFVFFRADVPPRPADVDALCGNEEGAAKLAALKARLEQAKVVARFTNPAEAAIEVVTALNAWQRERQESLGPDVDASEDSSIVVLGGDEHFVGRAADVDALEQLLAAHGSAVVSGPPGSGKTALVRRLGHRLAAAGTMGQRYEAFHEIDVGGSTIGGKSQERIAAELCTVLSGAESHAHPDTWCVAQLSRRRIWLVLRNVVDPSAIDFLLRGGTRSTLVVTTADPDVASALGWTERHLRLGAPSEADARAILLEYVEDAARLDDQPAVEALLRATGRHAFSLQLLGTLLRVNGAMTVGGLVDRLRREGGVSVPSNRHLAWGAPFRLALEWLRPEVRRMLAALADCGDDSFTWRTVVAYADWVPISPDGPSVDRENVAVRLQDRLAPSLEERHALRTAVDEARRRRDERVEALEQVARFGLIERPLRQSDGRYVVASIVRRVLATLAGEMGLFPAATDAHTDFFCATLLARDLDTPDAIAEGREDLTDLRRIVRRLLGEQRASGWREPLVLERAFEALGREHDALALCEGMVARAARLGDVEAEVEFRIKAAKYLRATARSGVPRGSAPPGDAAAAQLAVARRRLRGCANPTLATRLRAMIVTQWVAMLRALHTERASARALWLARYGVQLAESLGVPAQRVFAESLLGGMYLDRGDTERARPLLVGALAVAVRSGEWTSASIILGDLARVAADRAQAIDLLRESVEYARRSGSARTVARTLDMLGKAYRDDRRLEAALTCFEESAVLSQASDDFGWAARHTRTIAGLYRDLGRTADAIDMQEKALAFALRTSNRRLVGEFKGDLLAMLDAPMSEADRSRVSVNLLADLLAIDTLRDREAALSHLVPVTFHERPLLEEAQERELRRYFDESHHEAARAVLHGMAAHRLMADGRHVEAQDEWRQCIDAMGASAGPELQCRAHLGLAVTRAALGDDAGANASTLDALGAYASAWESGADPGIGADPLGVVRQLLDREDRDDDARARARALVARIHVAVQTRGTQSGAWAEVSLQLSRIARQLGDGAVAAAALPTIDQLFATPGAMEPRVRNRAASLILRAGIAEQRHQDTIAAADRFLALARDTLDPSLVVEARRLRAFALMRTGRFDAALVECDVGRAFCETRGDWSSACTFDLQAAVTEIHREHYVDALGRLERLRAVRWAQLPDRLRAVVLIYVSDCNRWLQQAGDDATLLGEALDLARRSNSPSQIREAAYRLAGVLAGRGRRAEAERLLDEAERHADAAGGDAQATQLQLGRAQALLHDAQPDAALALLVPVLERARAEGNVPLEASVLQRIGRAYSDRGELTLAEDNLRLGLTLAIQLGKRRQQAVFCESLGAVLHRAGARVGSREMLLEARDFRRRSVRIGHEIPDYAHLGHALAGFIRSSCAVAALPARGSFTELDAEMAKLDAKDSISQLIDVFSDRPPDQRLRMTISTLVAELRQRGLHGDADRLAEQVATWNVQAVQSEASASTEQASEIGGTLRANKPSGNGLRYGFIRPDDGSPDVYVAISAVSGGAYDTLPIGTRLVITAMRGGRNGTREAIGIRLASPHPSGTSPR